VTASALLGLACTVFCLGFLVGALVYFNVRERRAARRAEACQTYPDSPAAP